MTPPNLLIPRSPRVTLVGTRPAGVSGAESPTLTLEKRSGYRTDDLRVFFARGFRACGVTKSVHLAVVASPIRTRGCAEVGGARMVMAIAAPARFDLRRLARVFEHECAHLRGVDHEAMPHALLYSLGPTPAWAKQHPLRHAGRAPGQIRLLGSSP